MNHPIHYSVHTAGCTWRKDLQFAVGVVVAVGGAAALLGELARLFA